MDWYEEHIGAGSVQGPGKIKQRECGLWGAVGFLEGVSLGLGLREKGGGPICERLKRVRTE